MADPTNPNDPKYANDPNYVFSGGRWQYRGGGAAAGQPDPNAPAPSGHVGAESLGTEGGWGGLLNGLFGRLSGHPFTNPDGSPASPNGGIGASIPNAQHWQDVARAGAVRQQAVNPYNAGVADQSRGAQLALMQQMRGMQSGPSIANMQGQRAMGQMGQQALMQGGRGGMLGAQMGASGLAGDMGQARLAEMMRSQAGIGGAAGNLRGNDLRSADAQMGAGLQAQGLNDARARFYGGMGANLGIAQDRMGLENLKLTERLKQAGAKSNEDGVNDWMKIVATIAGGA